MKARSQAHCGSLFMMRVEDLKPVMAHAQSVGIGKGQAQSAAHLPRVLDDAVEFAAEILGGRLHPGQKTHHGIAERLIEHDRLLKGVCEKRLYYERGKE